MIRKGLWKALLYAAICTLILPTQPGCGECSGGDDGLQEKYVCDCCHGPGCFGLPGKATQSKETVCAPDEGIALGLAEEQAGGSSDSSCGGCRLKGQGEGTGERLAAPPTPGDTAE